MTEEFDSPSGAHVAKKTTTGQTPRRTRSPKKGAPNPPRARSAVTYARVSSKDQEKEGFSIPAQQSLLQGYAAEQGLLIAEEFIVIG